MKATSKNEVDFAQNMAVECEFAIIGSNTCNYPASFFSDGLHRR